MPLIDPDTTPGVQPIAPAGDYTLTFSDEFNQTSLDSTRWQTPFQDYGNGAAATNYDVNAGGNGALRIYPVSGYPNFTTDTQGRFTQTYGFWEARIQQPKGLGIFPSFWFFQENGVGGLKPEIDVYECYGYQGGGWNNGVSPYVPTNAAWTVWRNGGGNQSSQTGTSKLSDEGLSGATLNTAYHTFGCRWDTSGIKMYFDGVLWGDIGSPWTPSEVSLMYTIIDFWWGPLAGLPLPNATDSPQGTTNPMLVDYVRVWSLGGGGGPTFNASIVDAPTNGATISGVVDFTISGNLIENAELLPASGYTPSYGTFQLTGDTAGVLHFDTTSQPNGSFTARVAAFDAPSGQAGNEITAMASRTWTISNSSGIVMPVCTSFDIV